METKFFNLLILGRKYENEVADFFEKHNFSVWRLGNYRLPIDLYVWNSQVEFSVEVKFRSYMQDDYTLFKDWTPYKKIDPQEDLPPNFKHTVFIVHPNRIRIQIFIKDGKFTGLWRKEMKLCKNYDDVFDYLVKQNLFIQTGEL